MVDKAQDVHHVHRTYEAVHLVPARINVASPLLFRDTSDALPAEAPRGASHALRAEVFASKDRCIREAYTAERWRAPVAPVVAVSSSQKKVRSEGRV